VSYAVHSHATPHIDPKLQEAVDAWVSQQSFQGAVDVQEVNGKLRTAQHDNETAMVTASTYKVFVAYAVLHEAEQGTLSLNTKTRTGQTAQNALNKMILQSDNTAPKHSVFS
jgi:beta-lactamase class A